MFRFAFTGITSFSEKLVVLAGWMGVFATLIGFVYLIQVITGKLFHPETQVSGWASMIGVVIFFGGIQLLFLGVLGQYVGRIYRETKRRPLYILEESWGTEHDTGADG